VLRADVGALDRSTGLQVARVEVEALGSGDLGHGQIGVGTELVRVARAARIVAGGGDPAGQRAIGVLEPANVVALPAVHGDRDLIQPSQGALGIDAERCVYVTSAFVRGFDRRSGFHGESFQAVAVVAAVGGRARSAPK